ncbi:MAG: hypothetical protein NXI27_32045 [Alphaproteobacteria bacterium]|nr:hypothetical protein [Alphaproteobacteria bacterium]
MYYLSLLIARYVNWCKAVAPRLTRWQCDTIVIGFGTLPFALGSFLPHPFGAIVLWICFLCAPAVLVFWFTNGRYWRRWDEMKANSEAQTMKVKRMVDETYRDKS